MVKTIEIGGLRCQCCPSANDGRIAYILYPMDFLAGWIEPAVKRYGTSIVVITGMDWQNVLSPWPAKGAPKGSPDFKGEAPEFLRLLQSTVVPGIESMPGFSGGQRRTLVGVSMSGLFAMWQWMLCDTFTDIASLSGSFWYEGFIEWMKGLDIPSKHGMAYFSLGDQEPNTRVKAFKPVAANTEAVISMLDKAGIRTVFESVPGNHYSDPIPRLDKAFTALYRHTEKDTAG